ncbi:MAG: hypothetical protein AB7O96_18585 [Pseudobdellovibrionaceae bacterium]
MKTIKTTMLTLILAASFSANAEESKMKFDHKEKTTVEERKPNSDELANHTDENKYENKMAEKRQRQLDRWTDRLSAE